MNSQKLRGGINPVPLLMIFCLLCTGCKFKSEPEKVWDLRSKITSLAGDLVGSPYRRGGDEITGFDCSGLVFYVYSAFGLDIPRTAKKQGKLKQSVHFKNVKAGDILVFKLRRSWHSGIYIGANIFIHALNQKTPVKRENMNHYWKSRLKKVIQIIPD